MRHKPRYYQVDAEQAIIDCWNEKSGKVPYISVMTGLGKSMIAAMLIDKALKKGKRILCLVNRMELVRQNFDESADYIGDDSDIGIVCSQLGKMDFYKNGVIAMYQSFLNKRAVAGRFDIIIFDECDLVGNNPNSGLRKIAASLQRQNPKLLMCGMTASPYRLGQGMLHNDCRQGQALFTDLVYDTSDKIRDFIDLGYLADIRLVNTGISVDLAGIKMSGLEFNQSDCGHRFDKIVNTAVQDLRAGYLENSVKTSLLFASSIANAEKIVDIWDDDTIRLVHGKMHKTERLEVMDWLKNHQGERHVINCQIATRGFNFPALDAIALLTATTSPALLVQMTGRLFRPHEGKAGVVFDYGSNFKRLGTIDAIVIPKQKLKKAEAPMKCCGSCFSLNLMSAKFCKDCKSQFISSDTSGKYLMRTQAQILESKREEFYYDIDRINIEVSHSKTTGNAMALIKFYTTTSLIHTEYLCNNDFAILDNRSKIAFRQFFKKEADFYRASAQKLDAETVSMLMNNYPDYFKSICGIRLSKMQGDKYKRMVGFDEIETE